MSSVNTEDKVVYRAGNCVVILRGGFYMAGYKTPHGYEWFDPKKYKTLRGAENKMWELHGRMRGAWALPSGSF